MIDERDVAPEVWAKAIARLRDGERVVDVAFDTGISRGRLYSWRDNARRSGEIFPTRGHTSELREEARRLLESGVSVKEVARLVGVDPSTVFRWHDGRKRSAEENLAGVRHSIAVRTAAVERLKSGASITEVMLEFGVSRAQLYRWHDQAQVEEGRASGPASSEAALVAELAQVKQVLAQMMLERDFFAGALQRLAVIRQKNTGSGATPSTTTSGK